MTASINRVGGLLFDQDLIRVQLWTVPLLVCFLLRHYRPQTSALFFAGFSALQLVFGPYLIPIDLLALAMVYAALAHGDTKNTKAFVILSSVMGAFAAFIIDWVTLAAPLFADDASSDIYPCRAVYQGVFSYSCASSISEIVFNILIVEIALVCTFVFAFWQRARMETVRILREHNAAIEAREEEERHIAALAERARIARDMHDVVAHTLSIIIVQSDAGRYAGASNPDIARKTMDTIQHQAERALHDMKRLLGVFGGSAHADYHDIEALIAQAQSVDEQIRIQKVTKGNPQSDQLSVAASAAIYRLVQEALSNARRYAGPHITVTITESWSADGIAISVEDNGRGASASIDGHTPGFGLIGMHERIEAVGGECSAGPQISGGFAVEAFVPFNAAKREVGQENASHTEVTSNIEDNSAEDTAPIMPISASPHRFMTATSGGPEQNSQAADTNEYVADRMAANAHEPIETKQARQKHHISSNWIERLLHWAQRRYFLVDMLTMLVVWVLSIWSSPDSFETLDSMLSIQTVDTGNALLSIMHAAFVFLILLPLGLRRRFPRFSAAYTAAFALVQILFVPDIPAENIVALVVLYSVSLYGRGKTWFFAMLAALACSVLLGLRAALMILGIIPGYSSTAGALSYREAIQPFMLITVVISALCLIAVGLARLAYSRGTNALILQDQQAALQAEREKNRILAANKERDRISANIQAEVTDTLNEVITQAVAGIRMLDEYESKNETTPPEAIDKAFAAIGRKGREALARMRQLLSVLRETGFSDESMHNNERDKMALHPAANLEAQLQAHTIQGSSAQ